jgi:hypothetical protein
MMKFDQVNSKEKRKKSKVNGPGINKIAGMLKPKKMQAKET